MYAGIDTNREETGMFIDCYDADLISSCYAQLHITKCIAAEYAAFYNTIVK